MKLIPLTQGKYAAVDDADYGWLSKFHWHAKKGVRTWYAVTNWGRGKTRTAVMMHQLLCPFATGDVDHANRNGLFNSRANLRAATRGQNSANMAKFFTPKTTSQFKGCSLRKSGRWSVMFAKTYLGLFDSEMEAAKAYDKGALKLYGEFARLNFPAASQSAARGQP